MNLPTQPICFPSVAASCLPIATRSILSPLITTVAFGITLPSAGLITVAPTSAIFSACAVTATINKPRPSMIFSFIIGFLPLAQRPRGRSQRNRAYAAANKIRRAHAQRDQQNRKGNEKCANVRQELTEKCEYAEDQRRLHPDQPKQHANGNSGYYAVDGDAAGPCDHLSHQSLQCAVRLLTIP